MSHFESPSLNLVGTLAAQKTSMQVSILFPSGLWLNITIESLTTPAQACTIFAPGTQYTVEATHQCLYRRMLYDRLRQVVPLLIRDGDLCWFLTINKDDNPTESCLFHGAKLELKPLSKYIPEYGFCFARSAFVSERDRFNPRATRSGFWEEWTQRQPSDVERLLINRDGWEALYFVQPPASCSDITVSRLRDELCNSLQIIDPGRLSFTSGPYTWNSAFQEDGRSFYETYFTQDIVVDSRHMVTAEKSALVYVTENHIV
ncbi:uncharacterized protein TRUGW13939_04937 [Talaromyces rugulosus]|uniref:Uncharacterized protein n=1 Tax=Talaromyces rugulosus TaxID=121627 RepID=A0A7H8QV31_TALRU|nr:uncharacterized protein TRUGW13939_04937 [Talaromyces rugulosus]QKX57817.1 hypothetical protein TRUGW13939_04937 [Talaromyces rugulosus]